MKFLSRCIFTLLLSNCLAISVNAAAYVSSDGPIFYNSDEHEYNSNVCRSAPPTDNFRACPDIYGYHYLKNPPTQYVYPWYYIGYYGR